MPSAHARRVWIAIGWIGAVVATALNGVLVGYGAISFQFFGDVPDIEDYQVSAGGYGAAAFVLLLAVPAVLTHQAPRWLSWLAGGSAAVLAVLAANSASTASQAESIPAPMNTAWDGIGGVLWAPWTWVLVGLGVHGLYRLASASTDMHRPSALNTPPPD